MTGQTRWKVLASGVSVGLALVSCRDGSPYDPARCESAPGGCDIDGDGFEGSRTGGDDCDDADASIHPEGEELPYDGIDQDCSGSDLTDVDQDGHAALEAEGDDCDDDDSSVYPGAYDVVGDGEDGNCSGQEDYIYLFAGTGDLEYSGDGGPATEAAIKYPRSVAIDADGNVFIADQYDARVRIVTPEGIIGTYAGGGTLSAADGERATDVGLSGPAGLAVDQEGNLFFADTYYYRVRRVSPDGILSTAAGSGYSGSEEDGGPATEARLREPYGIALDLEGNLYIADRADHRIRKVSSGIISTVAGNGEEGYGGDGSDATSALLSEPFDVAVDVQGALYIADTGNSRIRRVHAGIIDTIAGTGEQGSSGNGGPAIDALLYRPHGVDVDALGNVYVVDTSNNWIRRIDPDGEISLAVGVASGNWGGYSGDGGQATRAELYLPDGVAIDVDGDLYVADTYNSRVRKVVP